MYYGMLEEDNAHFENDMPVIQEASGAFFGFANMAAQ
jgi:hypothetical protein